MFVQLTVAESASLDFEFFESAADPVKLTGIVYVPYLVLGSHTVFSFVLRSCEPSEAKEHLRIDLGRPVVKAILFLRGSPKENVPFIDLEAQRIAGLVERQRGQSRVAVVSNIMDVALVNRRGQDDGAVELQGSKRG
jgi:hypothetical protein